MADPTFTCDLCQETYEVIRSDAEAKREFEDSFSDDPFSDAKCVCHDCYLLAMGETLVN